MIRDSIVRTEKNKQDLAPSENRTDLILFYFTQRVFECACLSLCLRGSCCGSRYTPTFWTHTHTNANIQFPLTTTRQVLQGQALISFAVADKTICAGFFFLKQNFYTSVIIFSQQCIKNMSMSSGLKYSLFSIEKCIALCM